MNIRVIAPVLLASCLFPQITCGQITGFTEPFRQIELASDEAGTIAELICQEGSHVKQGQVLARLDDRVQQLQVESATHMAQSTSALDAARKYHEKRQMILRRIEELLGTGHATDSELIRADLEASIAKSKYMAAEEEAVNREIELRRAKVMHERRWIRAPFDGVVSKLHRQQGEFLSPLRPELVTLIQIDSLLAVFNVPSESISAFKVGGEVTVSFNNGSQVVGTVYSVGVQTDAESGTVQIKIRLDNTNEQLRSGEQCYLDL